MENLIVGSGLCGSYLAFNLAVEGFGVKVFDAKKEPWKKVCAGIVDNRIKRLFPPVKEVVISSFNEVVVHGREKETWLKTRKKAVLIDREALNKLVFELALSEGAKVKLGKVVKENEIRKWLKEKKLVFGCDGAGSVTRRVLGKKAVLRPVIQVYVKNPGMDEIHVFLGREFAYPFGYIIPVNEELRIGAGSWKGINRILNFLGKSKEDVVRKEASFIPVGLPIKSESNLILLGDAGCFVKAFTGGGINLIFLSIPLVVEAVKRGEPSKFYGEFMRRYGKELRINYMLRKAYELFWNRPDFLVSIIERAKKEIERHGDVDFYSFNIRAILRAVFPWSLQ